MNTAKMTMGLLVATTMGFGAAAQAGGLGEGKYRAELDRCLIAIRADLEDRDTTKILYTIRDVEKQGAWYQFDIQSEVYADKAAAPVREQSSRCRARRWSDQMEFIG